MLPAGVAAMLGVTFLTNQEFDPPLGAMCNMIFPPAVIAALSSAALTISLLIRQWWIGHPLSPPRTLVAFLTGVAHVAVVATGWWVLWTAERSLAFGNVVALSLWFLPLLMVPAVAPFWLVRPDR